MSIKGTPLGELCPNVNKQRQKQVVNQYLNRARSPKKHKNLQYVKELYSIKESTIIEGGFFNLSV